MPQEKILRTDEKGRFRRKDSEFRDWVTADGAGRHPAKSGRYHLYVAWACPWAHRTLLHRNLLGLEDAISFSVVHWLMDDDGCWNFAPEEGYEDPLHGARSLQDIYHKADPSFSESGTVPVLWDKIEETIVSNESRDIIRMMDTAFTGLQRNKVTFLPKGMEKEIDAMITANYEPVNNGVYRTGFAKTQEAYDEAVSDLFERLDVLEGLLGDQRYLCGDVVTEADWCLFTTLLRFDLVYHYHFKCNLRRLRDYPNLWSYTRELYQIPGVEETVDFEDTKRHYFGSHTSINPHRIVPVGPEIDFHEPASRTEWFPQRRPFAMRQH